MRPKMLCQFSLRAVAPQARVHQKMISLTHFTGTASTHLASSSSRLGTPVRLVKLAAWRDEDDDRVVFDDEDEWENQATFIAPNASSFLQQGLRAVGVVADRLTDVALQFAPEETSPTVVRTAVIGGMVLLGLSFVKGILSLMLLIGTVIFGAYVAVRIFGLDVGVGGTPQEKLGRRAKRGSRKKATKRSRRSEFEGLLGPGSSDEDDGGLLDVWFKPNKRTPR